MNNNRRKGNMKEKGVRIAFFFCVGLSAAIFASVYFVAFASLLRVAIGLFLLAIPLLIWKKPIPRIITLLLLGGAVGLVVSHMRLSATLIPAETMVGQTRKVSCRVVEEAQVYTNSQSVTVRLTEEDVPSVRCRLSIYTSAPALNPGDELSCTVAFSSARIRYGEESDSLTGNGIFLCGTLKGDVTVEGKWEYAWLFAPQRWRAKLLSLCDSLFPEDVSAFQKALLLGEKKDLYQDYDLYNDLSRTGLMHVAAVSGLHVSFFVGLLRLLLSNARLLSLFASPLLVLFAALTGFTPSVSRAVFMQLVQLAAPLARREADTPTSLAMALAILLCINPCSAGSISLQLSFGATAGILLCSAPLQAYMCRKIPKRGFLPSIARSIISAVVVSLSAMVFTLPLMSLHFGSVSLISPLTNALCLWLISFLFVGGFAALALGAFLPTAGSFLGKVLALGDRYVFWVTRVLSKLPFAAIYTQNPLFFCWLGLGYLILLFAVVRIKKKKKYLPVARLLTVLLLCLCLCFGLLRLNRKRPGLTVSAIDVGQGACTLLERGNTAVMIDCGGTNTGSNAGTTAGIYAISRGREELSALILTHLHRDHANGVEKLFSMVKVKKLYLPLHQEAEYEREILAVAEKYGTELVYVERDLLLSADGLTIQLTPPPPYEQDEPGLIVRGSCGNFDVLITGDADGFSERRYMEIFTLQDVELLLVGHHGSKYSACEELLDSITPQCAIISVGANTYGHPTEEALSRLQVRDIPVYRTDRDGTIRLRGEEDGSIHKEKCPQK